MFEMLLIEWKKVNKCMETLKGLFTMIYQTKLKYL